MKKTKAYATVALMATVGVAACDRSQDVDWNGGAAGAEQPMMQQEMDPELMQQVMEIQAIQQQLEPVQQEALQDEALAAHLAAVQGRIEAAMREENGEAVDRMDRLLSELAEAEAAGDQERMQALMMDGQAVQQEMQALQVAVLERPDIRGQVEEFEAAHRARMIQIDPEAESLLDRIDEIMAGLPR